MLQELIDAELTATIGAPPGERTPSHNGHRPKLLSTPANDITGTSTRKVDDHVNVLGCDSGIAKSSVSRICARINTDVDVLRIHRLDATRFVYVWLDANTTSSISENKAFWSEFPGDLVERVLGEVQIVIFDAHAGLRLPLNRHFTSAALQRCRVHARRSLLAVADLQHRAMISALIRTILAQPDHHTASAQFRAVADLTDQPDDLAVPAIPRT